MANDFYIEDNMDWSIMEQEFHEWQVLNDAASLIVAKGYSYVLSQLLEMVASIENK